MRGNKILVTGATGTVARPIAEHLVKDNEVWCAARFSNPASKAELEAQGIKTVLWDMGWGDNSMLPDDFTHVFHSAVHIGPSLEEHDKAITYNAEGAALLMQHCRNAEAFVHVSTFCVYRTHKDHPHHLYKETDALGCDVTFSASYPASKLSAEGAVRAAARMLDLPTTIARITAAYSHTGGTGGLAVRYYQQMLKGEPIPVPIGYENIWSPLSAIDYARQSEKMFEIATVPATIINWAGDDAVSTREMCEYIASITGLTATFVESDVRFDNRASDNTLREQLIGRCTVHWKEGIRYTLEKRLGVVTAESR